MITATCTHSRSLRHAPIAQLLRRQFPVDYIYSVGMYFLFSQAHTLKPIYRYEHRSTNALLSAGARYDIMPTVQTVQVTANLDIITIRSKALVILGFVRKHASCRSPSNFGRNNQPLAGAVHVPLKRNAPHACPPRQEATAVVPKAHTA